MVDDSQTLITLTVDDQAISAAPDSTVLSACLAVGIYIPHLCWHAGDTVDQAPASCRLCFVEIDGLAEPVTACTVHVENGMTVHTDTDAVRRLQKTALKLLLSVHRVDCKHCPANRACALQEIATFLGVGLGCKPFARVLKEPEVDSGHPVFDYYLNRCVLCGLCIRACNQPDEPIRLSFAGRGFDTVVGSFDGVVDASGCLDCGACLAVCPTGALVKKTKVGG